MYKSQWFSKILQMFLFNSSKTFLKKNYLIFFATAAKHSVIVFSFKKKKPLIVCERGVLFLLPFIVG